MVSAFVLIQCDMDKSAEVASLIGEMPGVVTAEVVTGPYDVIARAEANDLDELGKLVMSKMQMVAGITRTLSMPVVNI